MELVFVNIPSTLSEFFESNFNHKISKINGNQQRIRSVGHSWLYPTQIKGWRDWDFPNQEWGLYRDVDTYNLNSTDRVVTIVRNPFELLFDYYKSNWAWCKEYTQSETFEQFVDCYLSGDFHAPSFSKSMFSQLKDKNGDWILKKDSIVIKFEQLIDDVELFSKLTKIKITNYSAIKDSVLYDYHTEYTKEQIVKLNELWKDDLEYLDYSFDDKSSDVKSNIPKRKPKIALCLSGLIRDIETNKDFWLELIQKYDMDVYGSFWDTESTYNNDTIQNLKSIFNFKEVEFEKYSNFKKSTLDLITPYINPPQSLLPELIDYSKNFYTLPMWYKVWRANMLSKSLDIDYDIVVRGRLDTFMDGDVKIMMNDYLNVPSGRIKTHNWENSDGVCDIFAFGNTKLMDYYSSIYLNLLEYVNQDQYMIPPENLLRVHMSRIDIYIRFFTNKLFITRNYKGTPTETYDRTLNVKEEILPSTFVDSPPNPHINWTSSIRKNLKF